MEEKIKNEELEAICEGLQKYVGKEFELVELDNLMQEEMGTTCSLYEDLNTSINDGWCYVKGIIDYDTVNGVYVKFKLLEKLTEENIYTVKAKIENISVV